MLVVITCGRCTYSPGDRKTLLLLLDLSRVEERVRDLLDVTLVPRSDMGEHWVSSVGVQTSACTTESSTLQSWPRWEYEMAG